MKSHMSRIFSSIVIYILILSAIAITNGDGLVGPGAWRKCTEHLPSITVDNGEEKCIHQCAYLINEDAACEPDGLNLLNCSKDWNECPPGYRCEKIECQTYKCRELALKIFKLCRKPWPNEKHRGRDFERRNRYGYTGENHYYKSRGTGLKAIIIPIVSMLLLIGIVIVAVAYFKKRRQNQQRQAYAIQMAPTSTQPGVTAQTFPNDPLLPQMNPYSSTVTGYPNYPVQQNSYPNYPVQQTNNYPSYPPQNHPHNQANNYPNYPT